MRYTKNYVCMYVVDWQVVAKMLSVVCRSFGAVDGEVCWRRQQETLCQRVGRQNTFWGSHSMTGHTAYVHSAEPSDFFPKNLRKIWRASCNHICTVIFPS